MTPRRCRCRAPHTGAATCPAMRRIGPQQVTVGGGLRAGDVVGTGGYLVAVGRGDQVVEHVAHRDRVDRIGRPLRHRDQQEPVADVTQHLERRRSRADDHRRTQPHDVGAAVDGQRGGDLRAAGEVLGQRVVVGDETAEVDDAAHAGRLGRVRHVGRGAVVGLAEAGLTDAVHQVVDDVDRSRVGERRLRRLRVVRVQRDRRDAVMPTEVGQPRGLRLAATTSWPSRAAR